jgi:hypothetical protein
VYPEAHWPAQIAQALRGLIHEANLARSAGADTIDTQTENTLITAFRDGVAVGLSDTTSHPNRPGERKARLLLEVLRDREADVPRFVHDLTVPPTSNQAERDLRPAKVPAENLRAPHQPSPHPRPLPNPRLPVHRRQARPQHDQHPARGDPRPPLATTRSLPSLTNHKTRRAPQPTGL